MSVKKSLIIMTNKIIVEKVLRKCYSMGSTLNILTNFNQRKVDSDNNEKIHCDDAGECHICDKLAIDRY